VPFLIVEIVDYKIQARVDKVSENKYNVVKHNEKMYAIITIQHKKQDIDFVIDYENLSKIVNKHWHLSSGKYIATTYILENGTSKELYLHNFLKGKNVKETGIEKEYVIHINNNLLDNRIENLRVVDSTQYHCRKSKKERNITLPSDCGFTPNEIPKYISYCKPNGEHGDRFTIEIPRLNIFKKLTSSKKIQLIHKLEEAKKVLNELYEEYPEIDPNRENDLKNALLDSFNTIVSLHKNTK